jgi:hypothetical protein
MQLRLASLPADPLVPSLKRRTCGLAPCLLLHDESKIKCWLACRILIKGFGGFGGALLSDHVAYLCLQAIADVIATVVLCMGMLTNGSMRSMRSTQTGISFKGQA